MFITAFWCLSVGLGKWRATARTTLEMSGLVIVDSCIKLLTAYLYRQSPLNSSSAPEPISTPGVAVISDGEFTPKRFNMAPNKHILCNLQGLPNYLSRLKEQPVYQEDSSPRLFFGKFRNQRDLKVSAITRSST